jgi:hypothetical protein
VFLVMLVEHYEDERYPMGHVTPQQAVSFMLALRGLLGIPADILLGLEG